MKKMSKYILWVMILLLTSCGNSWSNTQEIIPDETINTSFEYLDYVNFSDEESQIQADIEVNFENEIFIQWKAVWPWFFEANFWLQLIDENEKILVDSYVTATDEWMTTEYVPFSGKISYEKSETEYWYIIFSKANPSWLEENKLEKRVKVKLQ